MGNDQRDTDNIDYSIVEQDKKRKNEIDKKFKNLKIDKTFVDSAIKAINDKRGNHGVKSLELDDYLNLRAFILAKEFLTKGTINNENLLYINREDLGMNLKMSNKKLEAEELMENWYEENKDYNYENPEELNCNNFTQMIWKGSEKFGIGYYHLNEKELDKKNQSIYININSFGEDSQKEYEFCYIALYYPAGNIIGEYKNNVLEEYFKNFVIIKEIEPINQEMNLELSNKNKSKKEGKQNNKGESFWNMSDEVEEIEQNENKDFNRNEIGKKQPNKKEIYNINEIEEENQNEKQLSNINEII